MTATAIRQKLYDYIRIAEDKKIKAIYTMLEDEITEDLEWWKDNVFTDELDRSYAAWQTGKEKGYSLKQVDASIEQLKKRRTVK
jgi:hypothetical protein